VIIYLAMGVVLIMDLGGLEGYHVGRELGQTFKSRFQPYPTLQSADGVNSTSTTQVILEDVDVERMTYIH
jgi:hypothetical protein